MGDVVLCAEVVEEVTAADAELGFEGACWVIETSVNYLVGEGLLLVYLGVVGLLSNEWAYRSSMHTSELRLLVSVPGASCRSSRMVEAPSRAASCRAVAKPTTPAPITFQSD